MQTANVLVRLGGHLGNTVPRYQVTAAEIAVLRAIHGPDSVYDVDPADDVDIRNRDELQRIREFYAGPNSGPVVERLYPGIGARVPETLDELDLDDTFYKAATRVQPRPANAAARAAALTDEPDENAKPAKKPRGKAAKDAKADAAVAEAEQAGVARVQNKGTIDDGIGDMPDSGLLG
jgi:hypothetical protein